MLPASLPSVHLAQLLDQRPDQGLGDCDVRLDILGQLAPRDMQKLGAEPFTPA